ncbi:MAG TPA: DUF4383 domain-containing protein [Pseudonocardiaceae bacterium]|nr:DUF4383 domain-containing protein [Pseudonocardiaceae bacterium]
MTGTRSTRSTRSPVQLAAAVVSVVFVLVGVLGFVPGAIDYDALQLAGTQSDAMLLGIFQVSVLHNIVHLAFGVVGLAMSRTAAAARTFLIGGGLIYVVLWLYGLFIDLDSAANFVPLNAADNWLHLALAAGMILLGVVLPRRAG